MNTIDAEQQKRLERALHAGLSIRAAATYAGVNKTTAHRYFHMLPSLICPCGEPLPHKQWCAHRVAMSPNRQAFLQRFSRVRPETIAKWARMKTNILAAIEDGAFLCSMDHDAMKDLKRFYELKPTYLEYVNGEPRFVAVAEPEEQTSSFDLFAAVERLHPVSRRFVKALIDGASVLEAAMECKISDEALAIVLPELRVYLRPYLYD